MSALREPTAAEAAVLTRVLPAEMTEDMAEVAHELYAALMEQDARCGQPVVGDWEQQLLAWAHLVWLQMQRLSHNVGGSSIYVSKGLAMFLSERDRRMCEQFRGDYKVLARQYGLTEVRVRQIVSSWQRLRYLERQQGLPGVEPSQSSLKK